MPLAVDYQGGIENAWSNVATFVPKLAAALVILLVGYLVAKAVASILNKVLERIGFDRVVERGGVRQVLARGAGIAILVFAVFAALDQLQIAPRIVTGLWYAILAAVVGSVIVAVGGGGIRTMQRYWDQTASRAEQRGPQLRDQARASAQATPSDGYDQTQTYERQSGGAYIDPTATEEFDTGRSRRRGR